MLVKAATGVGDGIFRENYRSMSWLLTTWLLVSEPMPLTVCNRTALVLFEKGFQPLAPCQCSEMIDNINLFNVSSIEFSTYILRRRLCLRRVDLMSVASRFMSFYSRVRVDNSIVVKSLIWMKFQISNVQANFSDWWLRYLLWNWL